MCASAAAGGGGYCRHGVKKNYVFCLGNLIEICLRVQKYKLGNDPTNGMESLVDRRKKKTL